MIYLKRLWTIVSVLACVFTIFFGIRSYQQQKHSEEIAIQLYYQWRLQMGWVLHDLKFSGINPNMELVNAELFNQQAELTANQVSLIINGRVASVFSNMTMVNISLNSELSYMIDYGKYVNGVYKYTVPLRVLNADRNFLYHQIVGDVLAGMPMKVTNVQQIKAQLAHLETLNNVNSNIGINSDAFIKFMKSTGQQS